MEAFLTFANNLQKFSYTGYCQTGAIEYGTIITLHIGTIAFILSKVTNEYSWVDRVWPILPILNCIHFFYHQTSCSFLSVSLRQWFMFGCITMWGLRLTYNFYRKGGFSKGGQDYRWVYIREHYPKFLVELLNFFFVSYYQVVLIYMFSSPVYYSSTLETNIFDIALAAIWLLLFCGQIIADEQQWEFQKQKYKLLKQNGNQIDKLPKPYNQGFVSEGLWKHSRHPNFFCEIMLWWVIYAFSISSSGFNYSGIGAFLLTLLFQGSTALTEKISSNKYPAYSEYKKTTPMLIPFPKLEKKKKIA